MTTSTIVPDRYRFNLLAALLVIHGLAVGQSKAKSAFEDFQQSGDRSSLSIALNKIANENYDAGSEIPALVKIMSSSSDPYTREMARGEICALAVWTNDRDPFRSALELFEHEYFDLGNTSDLKLGMSIVFLEARFGFTPSPRTLDLIYAATNNKDGYFQSLAFQALARISPMSAKTKALFRARLVRTPGVTAGPEMLSILVVALSDPDVVQIFMESAESKDQKTQNLAVRLLSQMETLPPQVVNLFMRLKERGDLDSGIKAEIQSALDRIEK